jgi:hypothetical protein
MENQENYGPAKKRVDESWKESIEKEKFHTPPHEDSRHPEPTFAALATSLAMQALVALGEVENPLTKARQKDLEAARDTIDLLLMLQEKTKGNLDREESALLAELIADLQVRFVENAR